MTMHFTADQIRAISLGYGKNEICSMVADSLNKYGGQFQVDTPMRAKHFLGQCCIESAFFSRLEESLYYTTAQRLMAVWPSRFKTVADAQPYIKNPQKLANFVYGKRMGNNGPDDGWRYRGSSIKQLTGFENFNGFNKWIHEKYPNAPDFVAYPDLLRTLEWAVWPAFYYWTVANCAYFADRDDAKGLTRAINGGLIGYAERVKATGLAAKVLNINTNPVITDEPPKHADPLLKEMQSKMKALSIKLNKSEFDPGSADGWNGPKTEAAVKSIQAYTRLIVDGKCGPNTRKAINMLCEKYGIPR